MRQPTQAALHNLVNLSLEWSLRPSASGGMRLAASRLHSMAIDLLATLYIEENDLNASNVLYKTLCKKLGEDSCQCCKFPLLDCQKLIQAESNQTEQQELVAHM